MTAAAPLVERTLFETADSDEARSFFSEAYGEHRLVLDRPIVGDRRLSIDRLASPKINVNRAEVPASFEIAFTGLEDEVIFVNMHEGQAAEIDHQGWQGETTTAFGPGDSELTIQPGVEWVHHTAPNRNTTIGVSESLLREVGGSNPNDTYTHWEPQSSKPIPGRAGLWRATTEMAEHVLEDPEAAKAPLIVGQTERMVAAAALVTFPNKLVAAREGFDHFGNPEVVRRAIAFIESNPQIDISAGDIARAAHCHLRTLQGAFRRHLNMTPMAYLRQVRLQHLREDLRAATAAPGVTVHGLALKWGFNSPSRLSRYYRDAFGESPSETLRR